MYPKNTQQWQCLKVKNKRIAIVTGLLSYASICPSTTHSPDPGSGH